MLFSVMIDSERDKIIDTWYIEPEDHERIHFTDIVFEMANNEVESSMRENLGVCDYAVSNFLELLVNKLHGLIFRWNLVASVIGFFVRIVNIKVEVFNRSLHVLHNLLTRSIFGFYWKGG